MHKSPSPGDRRFHKAKVCLTNLMQLFAEVIDRRPQVNSVDMVYFNFQNNFSTMSERVAGVKQNQSNAFGQEMDRKATVWVLGFCSD